MSFNITLDYRFDSSGFFDDPEAKAALEAAAAAWEALINDEFDDIPAGSVFTIANPSDRSQTETITLDTAIDDLMIFVGAYDLGGPLGRGGYNGTSIDGDIYSARFSHDFRGTGAVTDFEPFAGTLSFDTGTDWNFDLSGPVSGRDDFYSVALHEIGHVLGIGTAPIFETIGAGGLFDGVNALAVTGDAGIPLESDISHVSDDYAGDSVLMDPTLTTGSRTVPTTYDLAMLADIGYEIDGYITQGSTPEIVTDGADIPVFGTILADFIDGQGGIDQIQGYDGNDTLLGGDGNDVLFGQADDDSLMGRAGDDQLQGNDGNDTLLGGAGSDTLFGQNGVDTFEIRAQGGGDTTIVDFDLDTETIRLIGSGFASAEDVVTAIRKDFSNVSTIEMIDGTLLDVFHSSQRGSPLTADHFEVIDATPLEGSHLAERLEGSSAVDLIEGFGGNDTLIGQLGNDSLYGGDGADVLNGGDGDDFIYGGTSSADLRDVVYAGAGNDYVEGGYGNDELRGDVGNDTLAGGFGADTMIGGAGDDVVTGSAWGDLLYGGNGADRFYHLGNAGHGSDWIQDYNAADGDVLVYGAAASKSDFLVQTAFTTGAGDAAVAETFITHRATGVLLWALIDGTAQTELNVTAAGTSFDLLA